MAPEDNEKVPPESLDASSAHPPNWPGIPGRSQDHERHARGEREEKQDEDTEDAQVTKAQRELEASVQRGQR